MLSYGCLTPPRDPLGRKKEALLGRQRVPLSKITWSVTPSSIPDDLTALEQSMKEHGVQHRPVLDGTMKCIDGARQLEVFKRWGVKEVDVVVTDDLEFAIKMIAQRHDTAHHPEGVCRPIYARRLLALHETLKPLIALRMARIRQASNKTRSEGKRTKNEQYRVLMARALKLGSEAGYDRSLLLARQELVEDPEERAIATFVLDKQERGEYKSLWFANGELERLKAEAAKKKIPGLSLKEQRELIANALNVLGGVAPALAPVADLHPDHNLDELAQWRSQMRPIITALNSFYSNLKKGPATS